MARVKKGVSIRFQVSDAKGRFNGRNGLKQLRTVFKDKAKTAFNAPLPALVELGFLLKRLAQKKTPVETGNLRASAYVVWPRRQGEMGRQKFSQLHSGKQIPGAHVFREYPPGHTRSGTGFVEKVRKQHVQVTTRRRAAVNRLIKPTVEVGFTPFYAIYVHERLLGPKGNPVKHPVGEAKFLQKALMEVIPRVHFVMMKWIMRNWEETKPEKEKG